MCALRQLSFGQDRVQVLSLYNNSLINHSHDIEANIKIFAAGEKTGDNARKIRGRKEAPFAAAIPAEIKRTSSGRGFRRTGQ